VSCHGPVIDRQDTGLGEHPQRILFAGRFDDACQRQIAKHLIPAGGGIETEDLVGPAEGLPEVTGLGGEDLQRFTVNAGGVQPEIKCALAFGQPLAGCRLQRFDLAVVMGRAQVFDLARPPPG
jgi:hypothetical protein